LKFWKGADGKIFCFFSTLDFTPFFLAYFMKENGLNFIMKVAKSVKLKAIRGSY